MVREMESSQQAAQDRVAFFFASWYTDPYLTTMETMTMKKIASVLLAGVLFLGLTGCGSQYKDTNGSDDFTLQTITDQNIIDLDTGASGLRYSEESIDGVAISAEYSAKKFNGVEQIYLTNFIAPSDVSLYIGHMEVTDGNFKLAVLNNDEIIREIPLDAFNETFCFEDLEGSFSIHVAGESAAFSFYLQVL